MTFSLYSQLDTSVHCFPVKLCFVAETEEILCNFEEYCAFDEEWSVKERWTYPPPRKTKWDNTLNIRKFVQVVT